MKSFTALCLIALVASANTLQTEQDRDWVACIQSATDLVNAITSYISEKHWFDGPAVGKIVNAIGGTYTNCKGTQKFTSEIEVVQNLKISSACKYRIKFMLSSLTKMKSLLWKRKWSDFKIEFGRFKSYVSAAKSACR